MMLLGLRPLPFPTPIIPSPGPTMAVVRCWGASAIEVGRELLGVPFGVPEGVVGALSTLAFLNPDRGVMFELRKALTGVEISSFVCPFGVVSDSASGPRLKLEEVNGGDDPTILGVSGDFVALAELLKVGT